METLKKLNDLRATLKTEERELSIEVNFLGNTEKSNRLKKVTKKRRKTEKMIFALISKVA